MDEKLQYNTVSEYSELLPEYRREKTARFRFDKDKLRSLIAGLMIRRSIGDTPVVFGDHGKPYAADNSRYFSVSHSGDLVAVAVDTAEVGMDAEELPDDNRLRIADRFYHANERGYVHAAEDQPRAFCRVWTRKEAYLKYTGEGISADLTAFDTMSEPLSGRIRTFDLGGYCLSVCSGRPISAEDIYISQIELKDLVE